MTLQCEIEMVHTLKELEEMFEDFNDAKYIIALRYCRQRLQQKMRIREVTLNGFLSPVKYDVSKIDKTKLEESIMSARELSEFIENWIESEVKRRGRE